LIESNSGFVVCEIRGGGGEEEEEKEGEKGNLKNGFYLHRVHNSESSV